MLSNGSISPMPTSEYINFEVPYAELTLFYSCTDFKCFISLIPLGGDGLTIRLNLLLKIYLGLLAGDLGGCISFV